MKKVRIHIFIIIAFFIIYFLQSNFFTWFNIGGIMPNLFIILVLYIGLFMGRNPGIAYGAIYGIIIDVVIGRQLGISAIMLVAVAMVASFLDKNFSKDSRLLLMVMVMMTTIIYEIGQYVLSYIIIGTSIEIFPFIRILFIETIFNILLTIILYPIIQLTGIEIEEIFKGNKLLTRYF